MGCEKMGEKGLQGNETKKDSSTDKIEWRLQKTALSTIELEKMFDEENHLNQTII